ncbi:hypothetical protein CkaCkLH20_11405 [Colletotrichum karsti]|uniref:RING-type domain-containing protein n=1 Tax=Colletotrichum karsti TaxID=1095194 RepID=A0A9P6LF04_9PEZI|nr:uncharacterized protein CkaCkLH20_11405 [Colletotrichum karsti]KAF9870988.1 hypothetical protein CkaCkLH20_11405 [Colletotrichum karsti]
MSGRPSRKRPSPQVFGSSYTDSDYDDSPSKRHRSPLLPGVSIGGAFRPMRLPTRVYSPTANVSNTLPVLDHRLPVRNSSTFNTSAIRSSATPNADATQPGVDRSSAPWSSILGFPRFPPSSSPASRPPPASQGGFRNDFSPSGIGPIPPVSSQPTPVLLSSATLSAHPDSFPNPQARQHFTNTVDALKKSRAALEEILQGLPSYPLASGPLYKVIDAHNNLESWFISYAGSLAQNCACAADVEKEYFFADCKHRACAACLSKSGQCCKRNQSVFKAFFPQNDVCPICRDADNTMSILVCGHVVCRRCWDRMQRDTPLLSTTCPICRVKPAGPVTSYEPSITVALDATPQLN